MDTIDILVTIDENYIGPFETMLKSMVINNPNEKFHIWLLHSAVPSEPLQQLQAYCKRQGADFTAVHVSRSCFEHAPVSKQYPQGMYYRLLAPHLLPASLKRVLYLDPDMLIINALRPLWELDLDGCTFAAASHTGVTEIMNDVNRWRPGTDHDYYNSGVMLMDLELARKIVSADDIFEHVRKHGAELFLPDQDVFNSLYGVYTKPVPDEIWNYDVRKYSSYADQQMAHQVLAYLADGSFECESFLWVKNLWMQDSPFSPAMPASRHLSAISAANWQTAYAKLQPEQLAALPAGIALDFNRRLWAS